MLTFLKTVGVILVMFSIIPLTVWAGSGSWRNAMQAFKEYMFIIGLIIAGGVILGVVILVGSISSIS